MEKFFLVWGIFYISETNFMKIFKLNEFTLIDRVVNLVDGHGTVQMMNFGKFQRKFVIGLV